jgi:hypothetical protein
VSKRSDDLARKMGWKAQIGGEEAQPAPASANYQRKTYLVSPELVQRVKATAQHYKVGQNELVRFLLGRALDQLDAGELELPLEETYRIRSE